MDRYKDEEEKDKYKDEEEKDRYKDEEEKDGYKDEEEKDDADNMEMLETGQYCCWAGNFFKWIIRE